MQQFHKTPQGSKANFEGNEFWDRRFAESDYVYGTEPNAFFRSVIDRMEPGKLLLPAEGEGRNAVYAATRGWQVDAVDFSESGRDKALRLAADRQTSISYELADATTYTSLKRYDLIGLFYFHLAPDRRRAAYRNYLPLLETGGQLIAEFFHPDQLGNSSGGPKKLDWLITPEELAETFHDLDIQLLERREVELDEGSYHQGQAVLTRFIGTKPPGKF